MVISGFGFKSWPEKSFASNLFLPNCLILLAVLTFVIRVSADPLKAKP